MGSVSVALLMLGHTRNDEGVLDAAAGGCAEPGDGAGQGRGLRLALRPGLLCQAVWVHVRWRAERSPRAGGPAEELRPHAPAAPRRPPPTPTTTPAPAPGEGDGGAGAHEGDDQGAATQAAPVRRFYGGALRHPPAKLLSLLRLIIKFSQIK